MGAKVPETVPSAPTGLSSSRRSPHATGWRRLHTRGQGAVARPGQQDGLDRGLEAAQPRDEAPAPQRAFSSSLPRAGSLADLGSPEGGSLGSSLGGTGRCFLEGGALSPSTGRHERLQRPEQNEAAGQRGKVWALTGPSRSSMPPGGLGRQLGKWPGGLGEPEEAVPGDGGAGLRGEDRDQDPAMPGGWYLGPSSGPRLTGSGF